MHVILLQCTVGVWQHARLQLVLTTVRRRQPAVGRRQPAVGRRQPAGECTGGCKPCWQ